MQSDTQNKDQLQQQIYEDLTVNEHYRLLKVVHGKINLDPLYQGLQQYF